MGKSFMSLIQRRLNVVCCRCEPPTLARIRGGIMKIICLGLFLYGYKSLIVGAGREKGAMPASLVFVQNDEPSWNDRHCKGNTSSEPVPTGSGEFPRVPEFRTCSGTPLYISSRTHYV